MSNAPEPIIIKPLKGPHARRRFTKPLAKVQQLLDDAMASKGQALLAQVFFQYNARAPMFALEALGRVYEHMGLKDKLFTRVRLESKIVEDALGSMDFWLAVAKKCIDWSMPAGVTLLARDRYLEACGRTWGWIEAHDWVACRYHLDAELLPGKLCRKLKEVEWHSPRKEARVLARWLESELHDIHESIQQLDLNDIENGLHKSRREVRWVSIYFSAVEGSFVLDRQAKAPDNWDRYLTKEIVENPFNKLPEPEPDDVPLHVPAPLLYALSYAIDRMGVIKDRAEWTKTMEQLLQLTGEKASLPQLMGENYLEQPDATRQGKTLLDQVFVKDRVLLRMAEVMKEQG